MILLSNPTYPPLLKIHTVNLTTGNWDGFYEAVEAVAKAEVPAPSQCPLQFEFTLDAASNNASILGDYGFDLGEFIKHHPGSTVIYGSELRPLDQLQPLLQQPP